MPTGLYVALSAQMAMERRLATVANNVANMNTSGYRAERIRFEALMDNAGGKDVAFASVGETYTDLTAGQSQFTGNPLDVSVQGDAWFAVKTPGGTAYTRDGRMHMSADGQLLSVNNYPVLDAGGTPLAIDPAGGEVRIGADGSISQGKVAVGKIGLFTIPADATFTRTDNSAVIPDKAADMVQDFSKVSIHQGYSESSNVDPIREMTRLIMIQRAFEQAMAAVTQVESSTDNAIRTLGPGS